MHGRYRQETKLRSCVYIFFTPVIAIFRDTGIKGREKRAIARRVFPLKFPSIHRVGTEFPARVRL